MMTCLNTGFNSTFLDDLCMRRTDEPGAYTECFNDTVGKVLTLTPPPFLEIIVCTVVPLLEGHSQ